MEEGSILPSLTAGEPIPQAVMALVRAVQGWERPQEGQQGSQRLTFVYFCHSPSSMGKILEVAELNRFPPEALRHCTSPLHSSSRGNRRLFASSWCSSAVSGRGWEGPGTPEPWGKSHEPGSGPSVLEPTVPGSNNLGLSFGKVAGPGLGVQ